MQPTVETLRKELTHQLDGVDGGRVVQLLPQFTNEKRPKATCHLFFTEVTHNHNLLLLLPPPPPPPSSSSFCFLLLLLADSSTLIWEAVVLFWLHC